MKSLAFAPSFANSLFSSSKAQLSITSHKYSLEIAGLNWNFPIGLAAGLDKNAEAINFFSSLLFGAIEVGTVTPLSQPGNEKPRLFRLPEQESLRNRMGFNNKGMDVLLQNIKKSEWHNKILGINLGKNKNTPQVEAAEDYLKLYNKFCEIADYLVINISSPNTPGLRDLQQSKELRTIFDALALARKEKPCPLFLKISPDLSLDDIPDILELCASYKLDGVIATNTTVIEKLGAGGISGALLKEKASLMRQNVLKVIRQNKYKLEVIGVGGVDSFEDLFEFWKAGGKCMQLYTSFIYKGPEVLDEIKNGIDKKLIEYDVENLSDLLKKIQSL